ncbi:MAG: kinase-like domain-containing protein [Monoraphidium minutum]|nr:MAG: kinase-like domain-containing protein [Monoraphidium minutum]
MSPNGRLLSGKSGPRIHMDEWGPELRRRYRHVRVLGQGAFGEVALAEERASGRPVAVKRAFLRPGSARAARREAAALRAAAHPNVVALLEVHAEGPQLALVQELCTADLGDLIASCYSAPPPQIIKGLLAQLLAALAACHAAGVMHRDVKPSNLLLSPEGLLKLGDFGLARGMGPEGAEDEDEAAGAGGGGGGGRYSPGVATRWYRAPELLYGASDYDGAAVDVWGAGLVFAELLGLAPLIPGSSDIGQLALMQQLLGSFSPADWPGLAALPDYGKVVFEEVDGVGLAALLPDAPGAALALLGWMLRYPPHARPSAAQALAHPYFSNEPPPAGPSEILEFAEGALSRHAAARRRLADAARAAAPAAAG